MTETNDPMDLAAEAATDRMDEVEETIRAEAEHERDPAALLELARAAFASYSIAADEQTVRSFIDDVLAGRDASLSQ